MDRSRWLRIAAGCLVAGFLAGCGGGGGGGGGGGSGGTTADPGAGGPAPGADYFPLAVGNRWYYKDDSGAATIVRATGTQVVDGGTAVVLQSIDSSGTSNDLYQRNAAGVSLLPAADADPLTAALGPLLLLKSSLVAADHWVIVDKTLPAVEDYDGDGRNDTIAVHAEATVLGFETLTTATGTYTQVAHVQTVLVEKVSITSTGQTLTVTTTSDDWYAPDIGPVRNLIVVSGQGFNSREDNGVTGFGVGSRRSESVPPTVTAKSPEAAGGGCCLVVSVTFSEPIDTSISPSSLLQVTLPDGRPLLTTATWLPDGKTLQLAMTAAQPSGTYTVQVTTAVQDLVGNALAAPLSWQFVFDSSGPQVTPVQPLSDAVDVPVDTKIVFTFDEDPDPASVNTGTVQIVDTLHVSFIDATVSLSGRTVTLVPQAALLNGVRYQVNAFNVRDKYGNTRSSSWSFTTDPGRFAAETALLRGLEVTAVAIGDVDGDGRADLVMATGYSAGSFSGLKLFVYLQRPDGTLAGLPGIDTLAGYGAEINSISIADLDGQGHRAIVAAASQSVIQVFRLQGDGSFVSTQDIVTPSSYVVRVADMDGDGRLDIVGRPFFGSSIKLWKQAGDGSFGAPVDLAVTAGGYGDLAVGDLDGDGRNDIVIVSSEVLPGEEVGVLRQQADGSFAAAQYLPNLQGKSLLGVAIGDVNGDGRNDLVLASSSDSSIGVLLQGAQGQLGAMTLLRAATNANGVRVADIDGDGRMDVVSWSWGGWPLAILRQRADGALGAAETFPVVGYGNNSPGLLAIGDLSGDGRPDIAYGIGWMLQRPVPRTEPVPAQAARAGRVWRALRAVDPKAVR